MYTENKLYEKRVVIVTHEYATGPSHALEIYLKLKVKKLFFIAHPFVFAKDRRSHYRLYQDFGKLIRQKKFIDFVSNEFVSILKDDFLSFFWILKEGKFDVFVGVDATNALIGILLKKIGFIKKVIFYTIDYVPRRFENKILNSTYHLLDKFAVAHSDFVWNLSSIMVKEREKRGVSAKYRKKQIVVPVGTESGIEQIPFKNIKRFHVVHMGHLIRKQGVQLLIEAIPEIIKQIPQFHAEIIGGGKYEIELKKLAEKLSVSNYLTFYGFIEDLEEVERLLSYCALGIAPYVNSKDNYVRYTDPGKVKAYLTVGLPVIITRVPAIALEIEKRKCGVAIDYDKHQLAKAVVKILSNETTLTDYRKNAYKMGKEYRWDKVFHKAFEQTL
ncbi:MAG: glycosyltransferase [Patescibacteria group bacterium]